MTDVQPAALFTVKAGISYGTIIAARSIAKRNKVGAIVAFVAMVNRSLKNSGT